MLNVNLNATNQSVVTPPSTTATQESTLPEPVLKLLNDSTTLEAPYSPETLQTQLQQQKAAVRSTADDPRNIESDISDSMLEAIDKSAVELELIGMWSEGGQAGFQAALELIGQPLLNLENPQGSQNEDIFQLAMLDLLINAKEYGIDTDNNFMQQLSFSLEYIGTGQHNSWVEALPPASNPSGTVSGGISGNHLLNMAKNVWTKMAQLVSQGKVSQDSLMYRAMLKLVGNQEITNTFPTELESLLNTSGGPTGQLPTTGYFDTTKGGWITTDNNSMSPLMRLVFLSNMLKGNPEMSKATLETILKGNLKEINDLTPKNGGSYQHVYDYISQFDNPQNTSGNGNTYDKGWENSSYGQNESYGPQRPTGVTITMDFDGSLNSDWLNNLYQNYPKRVLGDEDIKEINRIGDNVKMIQQTLKYWYQILRDERLSIARNI
ncbi:hypothetical protein [Vibrio parahaemolyticus]|uniref:hypothetical protein n=1 Tax=Vibrio parahaemolyticus TaxID=670 RepID=UPI00041FA088|nr:hypothetical protein [Vibrio parahaemolyticus]ANB97471.1 hypothetical protein FORC14_1170 [Vibrio parahaemolyticus]EGQ9275205.1 hypothetical protein [Vibrio parahaemolyticus]EGQ9712216.1 hypothetical protein [Vibrio parahaemolyticus]EGQ9799254.1 hypothetical protein [Vibrio parahaemolyticus]EGR1753071.1 hypothetical protein [Vibrio parahaemolyticus]